MKLNLQNNFFSKEKDAQEIKTKQFFYSKNKAITAKNTMQKTLSNIDLLNNIRFDENQDFFIEKNKKVTFYGWAVDSLEEKTAGAIFLELNKELFKAKILLKRTDVSNAYSNKNYEKSGFLVTIPYSKFNVGKNILSLFILTSDKKYFYQTKKTEFFIYEKTESKEEKNIQKKAGHKFSYTPKISIITPVYNPKLDELKECIKSVIDQSYENWELCLVDDKSTKKDIKNYLLKLNHPKIKIKFLDKNLGISGASNCAIKMSTGEFIGFLDNDDLLEKDALLEVISALNKNGDLDLIYSDEAKINNLGEKYDYFFKPDFSPETLLSMNYICHFSVYRKTLIEKAGYLRKECAGAQDYDLVLKATELTKNIGHIPKILYYWRSSENSTAKNINAKPYALTAAKRALEEYLKRNQINGKVIETNKVWQIKYELNSKPSVEIIIPTGPKLKLLKQCINSIINKTSYENYKITVIDNSFSVRTFDILEEYKKKYPSKIDFFTDKTKPFNFSKINNTAAKKSNADFLLFLNDDTQVINKDWIERLLQEAIKKEAGAVGALLLYPNNCIQHAGVVIGISGAADHAFKGLDPNQTGYFNFHNATRNVSAVTFACAMVKRSKFFEVKGLDEKKFSVAYNDTDFCLKLIEKGYRNIYTPHAKLYHYESASRGVDTLNNPRFKKENNNLVEKWKTIILNDPYYNKNLTKTSPDYRALIKMKKNPYETIIGLILTGMGLIIALI